MNKSLYFLCLFLIGFNAQSQQTTNPFGLLVQGKEAYAAAKLQSAENTLVEIKKEIPNIVLDIRYATTNNFMKQVMYQQARAFARRPVVAQLKNVQQELNKMGYGLKIFDAYRPYAVTISFYEKASDKNFVANPNKGSRHNRGCAVDLTIINIKTGKELPMATGFDSFSPLAAANYLPLPPEIIRNRALLITAMERHGFRVLENEWWHFDFKNWDSFALMDIPFQEL